MSGKAARWPAHVAAVAATATAVGCVFTFGLMARWGTWVPALGTTDIERYFYPKFAVGNAAFAAGRLPLWNADEFCGLPFLATAQVAALYPIKLLLWALFDPPHAIRVNTVVHLTLAGAFAYATARAVGTSWSAGVLAAVATALCPGFLDSFYHPVRIMCLAWAPLAFWSVDRAFGRCTGGAAAVAGVVLGVMWTAGYPLYVLCLGLCLSAPFAVRLWCASWRDRPAVLAAAVGVALTAGGLGAIQLLPLLEMAGQTGRETLVARWDEQYHLTVGWAAAWTLPQAVFGTLAFTTGGLAGVALVGLGARPRRIVAGAFGALVVSQAANGVARPLVQLLPGFDQMRAAELIWPMLTPAFVAPLIALGWDRLLVGPAWSRTTRATLLLGPAIVGAVFFHVAGWVPRQVWLAYGVAAIAAAGRRVPAVRGPGALAIAGAIALLAVWTTAERPGEFNPYPTAVADPELRARLGALAGDGRVLAPSLGWHGELLLAGVPNVQGYEGSLHPARIGTLLDRVGLSGSRMLVSGVPDWEKFRAARRALDVLGLTVIVAPLRTRELEDLGFEGPLPFAPWGVAYRNRRYQGRVFAVHAAQQARAAEDALTRITAPEFALEQEAVLEEPAPRLEPAAQPSTARIVSAAPEAIAIEAAMGGDGLVVLTDAWFPGWHATVDGHEVPILRADYAFRAVAVPAGPHRIEMVYRPRGFRLGAGLAALAAVGAAVAIARDRRRA